MVSFELLCKHLDFEVNVHLFKRFYSIKMHVSDKGWFYFNPRTRALKLTNDVPSSIKHWKNRFIFCPISISRRALGIDKPMRLQIQLWEHSIIENTRRYKRVAIA